MTVGNKIKWTRNFSEKYLVDREYRKLSFYEHGFLKIATDILWCQTDKPGKYIIKGRIGTESELIHDAISYTSSGNHTTIIVISSWYHRVVQAGGLAVDHDGTIYSPFILKELKTSHMKKAVGSLSVKAADQPAKQGADQPAEPTLHNNTLHNNSLNTVVKNTTKNIKHTAPDAAAFPLANYQTEVLNKCAGREAGSEHPNGGLIFLIAKHVPREHVMAALGAMQDARNNNLNRDPAAKQVFDLEKYYFGTIRKLCRKHNIETPIKWNGSGK